MGQKREDEELYSDQLASYMKPYEKREDEKLYSDQLDLHMKHYEKLQAAERKLKQAKKEYNQEWDSKSRDVSHESLHEKNMAVHRAELELQRVRDEGELGLPAGRESTQ